MSEAAVRHCHGLVPGRPVPAMTSGHSGLASLRVTASLRVAASLPALGSG